MDHVLSMLPQCFRTSLRLTHPLRTCPVRYYPRMAGASREERYDINLMNQRIGDKRLEFNAQEVGDFVHKTMPMQHYPEGFAGDADNQRVIRDPRDVKRSIIRAKYLREQQPASPCLLTCAAREQLRFLHKRDPLDSSAERLADSFPMPLPDLQRFLATRARFRSPESTAQEDQLVAQRWKALKTGKNWRQWVTEEQMRLYREGKLHKAHFMGNDELPLPPPVQRFVPPPPVEGPVSRLLATVMAEKKRREPVAPDTEMLVGQNLLRQSKSVTAQPADKALMSVSAQLLAERIAPPAYEPMDMETPQPMSFQGAVLPYDPGLEDELADPAVPDVRLRQRTDDRGRPKRVMHAEFTGKMLDTLDDKSPEVGAIYRQWFRQREGGEGEREVRVPEVEEPRRRVHKYKEAWVRAAKERAEGGQEEGRLEIPEGLRVRGAVYQKGNEFYDEQGQFMYRVPGLLV